MKVNMSSTINMLKNIISHLKKKCIPIKYHFLRENVADQSVKLEYVTSKEKFSIIFTKTLPKEDFEYLRERLWVTSLPYSQ